MTDPSGLHSTPTLECDIIMKGGITSGVIYPRAVSELARTYRLRSVGGSSAGAIAASAAAAAELGRAAGGFDQLDRLPSDLTAKGSDGRSRLATLFQPTRTGAPLFRVLEAVSSASDKGKTTALLFGLLRAFKQWAVLFALPGIVLVVLSALGEGLARWAGIIGGLILLLLGAAVGLAVGASRSLGRLAGEGWGMCSGMEGRGAGDAPALTPWLHSKLQAMAARPEEAPITFGDLDDAGVTLRMMTTNLTRRQPTAMPWATREFFFDPAYFRTLFPADVVQHMVDHPPPLPTGPAEAFSSQVLRAYARSFMFRGNPGGLRPWPDGKDLPIVVATRMSLSFPLLIQAVRLAAVDYTLPANREALDHIGDWRRANPEGTPEQAAAALGGPAFSTVWFTDGGLCANLPVHFFDSPLPRRPTFAFNLSEFPPGREKFPDEASNSYLPTVNQGGVTRPWYAVGTTGLSSWLKFAGMMVNTALTWVDDAQLVMPGYRDRIVTVWHDHSEGGMNLNMPEEVVTALAERGRQGAVKLTEAFAPPSSEVDAYATQSGWDNHRWIRFRTSAAGLSGWLGQFLDGYRDNTSGGTPYPDLAGPEAAAPLPSYRPTASDRKRINERTGALVDLADDWTSDDAITRGAPRPTPRLRLVPDDGTGAVPESS